MVRRKTVNVTGITRIEKIPYHDAWVGFICIKCNALNNIQIGKKIIKPEIAYKELKWKCKKCGFIHKKTANPPFENWPAKFRKSSSIKAQRFWEAFFRICTEHPESYWKQCNVCSRILPFNAFSKHRGWGPLERQMECRSCKGAINAELNPKRTREQLYESSIRRRVAELLVKDENEKINEDEIFRRFGGVCFKTKKKLDKNKRGTWAIDHILPSKWLWPLKKENAALLCKDANNNKRDNWPSAFYTNNELIELAKITGADLVLLSSKKPVINKNIDINNGVAKYLSVREKSNLQKRVTEIRKIISGYKLKSKLNRDNKKLLGF